MVVCGIHLRAILAASAHDLNPDMCLTIKLLKLSGTGVLTSLRSSLWNQLCLQKYCNLTKPCQTECVQIGCVYQKVYDWIQMWTKNIQSVLVITYHIKLLIKKRLCLQQNSYKGRTYDTLNLQNNQHGRGMWRFSGEFWRIFIIKELYCIPHTSSPIIAL